MFNRLSRTELEDALRKIQKVLYCEPYLDAKGRPKETFDRNKVWDSSTLSQVDEVMGQFGLSPEDNEND